jgi:hypothetical protein
MGRFFFMSDEMQWELSNSPPQAKANGVWMGFQFSILLCLSGCQAVNPTLDTLLTLLPSKDPALMVDRGFEYLLIEIDGRKTAMALGSREVLVQHGQTQVHERWYSGQREMLHMVNGRLHTAVGLTVEWRDQRSSPPTWEAVGLADGSLAWARELDIMPGYRFGQIDQLQTHIGSAPKGAPTLPAGTRWFSDSVRSPQPLGGEWVFAQHFALHQGRVVYSEQCLAPSVCFKFQSLGLIR